jgi:two-component system chemotaxis response regulator CheY
METRHRENTEGWRERTGHGEVVRALIIEDSRAMRSILAEILQDVGFEVALAADAEEALVILENDQDFELALVDWNLPAMSGLDLVTALRESPTHAGVKLMMVTTETQLGRVREALEAGADEYIMKPFDREMLLEKLVLLGIEVD